MKLSHFTSAKTLARMARTFGGVVMIVAAVACSHTSDNTYTVTVPLSPEHEGTMAYLIDFDNSTTLDSTVVTNERAIFAGSVAEPRYVRVIVDHQRLGNMILEPGELIFTRSTRMAEGGELNTRLNDVTRQTEEILSEISGLDRDDPDFVAKNNVLTGQYDSLCEVTLEANASNALGYVIFIDQAYELDIDSLDRKVARYPRFANSVRLSRLRESLKKQQQTAVGKTYKDFEIVENDSVYRLSDYISSADGRYTLVDFWASWCHPCLREIETLKRLYSTYGPAGTDRLNVLGVAVWDDPIATRQAISDHSIPWPQILGAQSIPTDLYGISGIPCIIVIAPDGTIVSRGLQGEDLVKDVERLLSAPASVQ